jgi:dTDP-4-dehydrorhamnose 3,5-epimerase-like enzyme
VQDNHSRSQKNVLRGLHYQIEHAQGKLVRVTAGAVYDVAVDLRRSSPTFGQWVGFELSAADHRMAWIPPGFAHGFCVTSDARNSSTRPPTTTPGARAHPALERPATGDSLAAEWRTAAGRQGQDRPPLACAETFA